MRRGRDRESGATAIEFVVLTPLLFLVMFGSVQLGLNLFAQHVAVSAAQEGARTARERAVGGDWEGPADNVATGWVNDLLGSLVSAGPTPTPLHPVPVGDQYPQVGMKIDFSIVTVVPLWTFDLSASSVGPVECFYNPQGFCDGP